MIHATCVGCAIASAPSRSHEPTPARVPRTRAELAWLTGDLPDETDQTGATAHAANAHEPHKRGPAGSGVAAARLARSEGCANKEIARRLVIGERTARTPVSNILRKLQLASRTQAALVAVEAGLRRDPTPPP
jgi:hypothetical protein